MRKLRSLTGMSVVCGSHRIGRLLRAELTADLRQLSGIWVGAGLMGTRFIPAERLEMLGRVAVMADDRGRRGSMRSSPLLKRAVSTDGRRLGAITGAEIDEVIIDPVEATREEGAHEGWFDEGPADRYADRRVGGDDIRRHELADGEALEPEGPPDGQLDFRQGG